MFAAAMSDASLGIVLLALTEQVGRNVRMSQQRILSRHFIEVSYREVCIEEQQNNKRLHQCGKNDALHIEQ